LKQTLEQRLQTDPELARDYASFRATMEMLSGLAAEVIEAPVFLSDRIATRVEEAQAKRSKSGLGWILWVRNLAFAGVAATAILGAFLALRGNGATSEARLTPGVDRPVAKKIEFKPNGRDVDLTYTATDATSVVITSGDKVDRRPLQRGQSLITLLKNPNPSPALFTVTVAGDAEGTVQIVLPGSEKLTKLDGEGNAVALAKALAAHFQVPVMLRVSDAEKLQRWNFAGQGLPAVITALEAEKVAVDQLESSILSLRDR
jgi:hypothetical protein